MEMTLSAAATGGDRLPLRTARPDEADDIIVSTEVLGFCVSAVPAAYVTTDDLIIRDTRGRTYMLTSHSVEPVPLDRSELDLLGMVYEPAQDTSWHTAAELHRMFFGSADPA